MFNSTDVLTTRVAGDPEAAKVKAVLVSPGRTVVFEAPHPVPQHLKGGVPGSLLSSSVPPMGSAASPRPSSPSAARYYQTESPHPKLTACPAVWPLRYEAKPPI